MADDEEELDDVMDIDDDLHAELLAAPVGATDLWEMNVDEVIFAQRIADGLAQVELSIQALHDHDEMRLPMGPMDYMTCASGASCLYKSGPYYGLQHQFVELEQQFYGALRFMTNHIAAPDFAAFNRVIGDDRVGITAVPFLPLAFCPSCLARRCYQDLILQIGYLLIASDRRAWMRHCGDPAAYTPEEWHRPTEAAAHVVGLCREKWLTFQYLRPGNYLISPTGFSWLFSEDI